MAGSMVFSQASSALQIPPCCVVRRGFQDGFPISASSHLAPVQFARPDVSSAGSCLHSSRLRNSSLSSSRLCLLGPWRLAASVQSLSQTISPRKQPARSSPFRSWKAELKPDFEESSFPASGQSTPFKVKSSSGDVQNVTDPDSEDSTFSNLVGEDAGVFDVKDQKTSSWIYFTLVLGVVLAILYVAWLDPNTGYGTAFVDALASFNAKHEVVMLEILFIFALVHSGGASLRASGEKLIGERAYRVLFAGISLPLAVSAVVYFINHRYDGVQLWQVRDVPGVHEFCWIMSFISFLFLYPSTFNLLEVAAVDKPKVHMYETGIMRITRHPQMVGQFLWCLAHTLWIGNSFTVITSLGLLGHHLFGVWHGDKRLEAKYGESFEIVKKRTSVVPFAAILDGRQQLPDDYYKEFMRVPYYVIVGFTVGAYLSHPLIQWGSHYLGW
ncbi:zeta-carotene isomerase [Marchantia polymorpha subsp. ruderalis]